MPLSNDSNACTSVNRADGPGADSDHETRLPVSFQVFSLKPAGICSPESDLAVICPITLSRPQDLTTYLLFTILEIGFRLVVRGPCSI